jgi:hypothetical protein
MTRKQLESAWLAVTVVLYLIARHWWRHGRDAPFWAGASFIIMASLFAAYSITRAIRKRMNRPKA